MIPAYRDPCLHETIHQIFMHSDYPERVFVAIGAQYDNISQISFLSKYPQKNIKMLYINPENRPGVYRLRSMLNDLYDGEDYFLSIDSHTDLEMGWDTRLISILEDQPNYKTVLESHQGDAWGTDKYNNLGLQLDTDGDGTPKLKLDSSRVSYKPSDGSLPIVRYLPAGVFFTRGEFAREIRWGRLWQDSQEEAFLSYEVFMHGWEIRVLIKQNIINHNPDKYYEHVYMDTEQTRTTGYRNFADKYSYKQDGPEVNKKILEAYLFNSGPFKLDNPIYTPRDWWETIGLLEDFNHLCNDESLF